MSDPDRGRPTCSASCCTRVGEDRVLWGTDAIWYGSPQPQIMAFRAFQISAELPGALRLPGAHRRAQGARCSASTRRGCSASTPRRPAARSTATALEAAKVEVRSLAASGVLPAPWQPRGPVTRREVLRWLSTTPYSPF